MRIPMQTQPFKTADGKHSPSDVSIILFTDENVLNSGNTEKSTERPTLRTPINQEARRRDKTPAHTINVQSLMASVDKIMELRLMRTKHGVVTTVPARHTSNLKRVIYSFINKSKRAQRPLTSQ